jgi:hypothetical protein
MRVFHPATAYWRRTTKRRRPPVSFVSGRLEELLHHCWCGPHTCSSARKHPHPPAHRPPHLCARPAAAGPEREGGGRSWWGGQGGQGIRQTLPRRVPSSSSPESTSSTGGEEVTLAAAPKIYVASFAGAGGAGDRCRERALAVMDPHPRRDQPPLLHPASLHRLPDHGAPSAALAWEPCCMALWDLIPARHRRRAPSRRRPARPPAPPQPQLLRWPRGLRAMEMEGFARPAPPFPPRRAAAMSSTSPIPLRRRAPSRRHSARPAAPQPQLLHQPGGSWDKVKVWRKMNVQESLWRKRILLTKVVYSLLK